MADLGYLVTAIEDFITAVCNDPETPWLSQSPQYRIECRERLEKVLAAALIDGEA